MSRSFKKTPIFGHGGASEKQCKRKGNRCMRRANKVRLKRYEEDTVFMVVDEAMNPWSMAKDGRSYWKPSSAGYSHGWWEYKTPEEWLNDRLEVWRKSMRK